MLSRVKDIHFRKRSLSFTTVIAIPDENVFFAKVINELHISSIYLRCASVVCDLVGSSPVGSSFLKF